MALVNCHECKREVSTEAKACPHCGATVRRQTRTRTWGCLGLVVGGFLLVMLLMPADSGDQARQEKYQDSLAKLTPRQKEARQVALAKEDSARKVMVRTQDSAKVHRENQIFIARMGAVQLKQAMKDPEAFELRSLVLTPNGTACYSYRAKNSFGAILPGHAVLTRKGNMILQEQDQDSFARIWNAQCSGHSGDELVTR